MPRIIQRQGSRKMKNRPGGAGAGGSTMKRMVWVTGYLVVFFGALMSTYVVPTMFLSIRSESIKRDDMRLVLTKGELGGQTRGLSWKQELPPHLSRSTKLDVHSEQEEHEQKVQIIEEPTQSCSGMRIEILVSGKYGKKLWTPPSDGGYVPCTNPDSSYSAPGPTKGYLMVSTNGGLNQMRAGICDMVAVARLINATLVIPELDKSSFWHDSSIFSDVFDVDYFIEALKNDVPVIKKLPKTLKGEPKVIKQFRSWSYVSYYEEDIARLWQNYKVIKAAKSDSRLANNNLPPYIQKLRCRVNYDALRFAPHIQSLGQKLVNRMRSAGPFIALHLRYEKDMLAFSGCTYGLNKTEAHELTTTREHTPHWRVKKIDSEEQRSKGFCPLTPTEVGIFLRGLGYPETTRIYIAAGEIYGGQQRMAGLLSRFPHVMCKETLATKEEMEPFMNHSSQMAALDYIVAVESDVFVPSYSGNMARAVEGHRRFLGHRKTVTPDRKGLVALLDKVEQGVLCEGQELTELITASHHNRQGGARKRKGPLKGTKGRERFRTEEAFYTNPIPDCLCRQQVSVNTTTTTALFPNRESGIGYMPEKELYTNVIDTDLRQAGAQDFSSQH